MGERELWVYAGDRALHLGGKIPGVARRTDHPLRREPGVDHLEVAVVELCGSVVDRRPESHRTEIADAAVLKDIADHAHDGSRRLLRREVMPDGVAVLEVPP